MKLRNCLSPGILALTFASIAAAATIPASSSLSGLNPGDTYRFVFVTSTTTANSNSLATYNNFVQGLANAAGIGNTIGLTWTAMVSVGSGANNAASNAPVSGTTRVYLLDGTMVANGTTNPFYTLNENTPSATPHLAPINYTEAGTTLTGNNFVWTGGNANGSESGSGLVGGGSPIIGNTAATDPCRCSSPGAGGWARYSNTGSTGSNRVYAISAAFTVPSASTPEPATLGMAAFAFVALGLARRFKKV